MILLSPLEKKHTICVRGRLNLLINVNHYKYITLFL
jgi:hypothetical protein